MPSKDFTYEKAEIYLPAILKSLSIDKVSFYGYSVGGTMAIDYAALSNHCESVTSESAQTFVEERTRNGILRAKREFENPETLKRLGKYHGERNKIGLVRMDRHFALEGIFPRVTCPILALPGENDEYGSTNFPDVISKLSGGNVEKQIVKNCGHVLHRASKTILEYYTECKRPGVDLNLKYTGQMKRDDSPQAFPLSSVFAVRRRNTGTKFFQ